MPVLVDQSPTEIIGYSCKGSWLVYYTSNLVRVIDLDGDHRSSLALTNIQQVSIGESLHFAVVYCTGEMEIRNVRKAHELLYTWKGLKISPGRPVLRWSKYQLYLLYWDKMEIYDFASGKNVCFTDMIEQETNGIYDLAVPNVLHSIKTFVLQLKSELIFTIMHIPAAKYSFPCIDSMLTLRHPKQFLGESVREHLCVVSRSSLFVYNLLSLKQIALVSLECKEGETVSIKKSPSSDFVLLQYSQKGSIARNRVLKVNVKYYLLDSTIIFKEAEPFFLHSIDSIGSERMELLEVDFAFVNGKLMDVLHLIYQEGNSILRKQVYNEKSLISKVDGEKDPKWRDDQCWRDVIVGQLQSERRLETQYKEGCYDFAQEDRRLRESAELIGSLEEIVQKFIKSSLYSHQHLNQGWSSYLLLHSLKKRFLLIERELAAITIQFTEPRKTVPVKRPSVQFDPVKEEEDYQRMTRQFLAQKEANEKRMNAQRQLRNHETKLIIPKLDEEDKRKIARTLGCASPEKYRNENQLLGKLQDEVEGIFQPLQSKLKIILDKLIQVEEFSLESLKKCEAKVKAKLDVNVPTMVDEAVKKMLKGMSDKIEGKMADYAGKLQEIDVRCRWSREGILRAHRRFVEHQVEHRLGVFYRRSNQVSAMLSEPDQTL